MNEKIGDILYRFKEEPITSSLLSNLKSILNSSSAACLKLWQMKPSFKFMLTVGKMQCYMILISGIVVMPYMIWEKYNEDNDKLTKLMIYAPFATAAIICPILIYKKYTKNLIQSIAWDAKNGVFEIKPLSGKVFKQFKATDIKIEETQTGRIKNIILQGKVGQNSAHQIQGAGDWYSIQLFKYLLKNPEQLGGDKEHL